MRLVVEGTPQEVADLLDEFLKRREQTQRTGKLQERYPIQASEDGKTAFQQISDQGECVSVDLANMHLLVAHRWHVDRHTDGRCYARTNIRGRDGSFKVYLHRMIMKAKAGEIVDHINHDGLDNRTSNLRIVTASENNQNRSVVRGRSKYRGVSQVGQRYRATIQVQGKSQHLGMFSTPEDAARAYDDAARLYFGKHAATNYSLGLLETVKQEGNQ